VPKEIIIMSNTQLEMALKESQKEIQELKASLAATAGDLRRLYHICERVFHCLDASVDFERAKAGWAEKVEFEKNAAKAAKGV
jgi:hypothetical protein